MRHSTFIHYFARPVPTFSQHKISLFSANSNFAPKEDVSIWGISVSQNEDWDSIWSVGVASLADIREKKKAPTTEVACALVRSVV